jgi:hypothetical protein
MTITRSLHLTLIVAFMSVAVPTSFARGGDHQDLLTSQVSVLHGYSAASDFFPTAGELLLQGIRCTGSTIVIKAGSGGTNQYIYDHIFYWNGGQWWRRRLYSISKPFYIGNWIVREGTGRFCKGAPPPHIFTTYGCQYVDNNSRCGCRNETCATSGCQSRGVSANNNVASLLSTASTKYSGKIIKGIGMGTTYTAQYLPDVTGGGPFPDIRRAVTANCAGDGKTDDTDCLQNAADQAASTRAPLLIPFTHQPYIINRSIGVSTSVIGTGGMPTIKQKNSSGDNSYSGLHLRGGMIGWVYNLHIVGSYDGEKSSTGEWAHNIYVDDTKGVTIKGNLLENARGDNIGDGSNAKNVIIDSNSLINALQCNIALVEISDRWVITNNFIDYRSGYVSPVCYEPWHAASYITNIEFAYNRVDCHAVGFGSCMQITAWFDRTPGENIYTHHNYGSWVAAFPTDHGYKGSGVHFKNVVTENNAEGDAPPR